MTATSKKGERDLIDFDIPDSLAPLAKLCADLKKVKEGIAESKSFQEHLLGVNVDAKATTLQICLGAGKGDTAYGRDLLLWVEKPPVASRLSLQTQVSDWEKHNSPKMDREMPPGIIQAKLPYAKALLMDIHLGREGDYYYVHLLVADSDQAVESRKPVRLRFQLGAQGCYQLGAASDCPPVVPVGVFLNPPLAKPKLLTANFSEGAVLPWSISLGLLMSASALVGWICALAGQSREGAGATMVTLMLLLGTVPFFARRVGGYTLSGLLIVTVAGVLASSTGFLFDLNVVVFACLVMAALLSRVFCSNAYGKAKEELINLEKSQHAAPKFLATRTEQEQNMLWIGDFIIMLVIVFLLAWGYSGIQTWIH